MAYNFIRSEYKAQIARVIRCSSIILKLYSSRPCEDDISRRNRSAKSHFPCDVYHVLACYSILFDDHI